MAPVGLEQQTVSDEEYLVMRAKDALNVNPYEAKSWMLTAKTLFPDNFGVQFEAYQIEKSAKSIKEAAKCLSQIFQRFQDEPELWHEVEALTVALRSDATDAESVFLRDLFSSIPTGVQHEMLLQTASRSEDTVEHCRLLLLLLRQFPATVPLHGPKLMETLMTAEKHSHYQNAVNCYRKLLVCDLLPLLGSSQVELSAKHLFRMLQKSIEFYLAYLMLPNKSVPDLPELESKIEDPWKNLFAIQQMTGKKLNWELSTVFWNKELYWQKLVQFRTEHPLAPDDYANHKQMLYCTTTFFLYCLHEYVGALDPGGGEPPLVLVEEFVDSDESGEPEAKRPREAPQLSGPVRSPAVHSFLVAVRCWDLLCATDSLHREFARLAQHLKLDAWLHGFLCDAALYRGETESALSLAGDRPLRVAGLHFSMGRYRTAAEQVLRAVATLPAATAGPPLATRPRPAASRARQLVFLPQTRPHLLRYCVRLLLAALERQLERATCDVDSIVGHAAVLCQLDWPSEEQLVERLLSHLRRRSSFSYPAFRTYIVTVDLLEEFVFLATERGGGVTLDIIPAAHASSQRRISTRGADKGVKEDLRQAMRRQVARSTEPIEPLIIRFLSEERESLLRALDN